MPRRIPKETREEINRLYNEGLKLSEIARQTGVSCGSVYGMTRARQRTNPETGKPFESLGEYVEFRARQRTNPETGKPFESLGEYEGYQARHRTNPETGKPFESRGKYEGYQARHRTKKEVNRELSDFVRRRLKWMGLNQSWLAKQMGVSRQAVSLYLQGKSIPHDKNLRRLLSALDITKLTNLPKSLEDLVDEEL